MSGDVVFLDAGPFEIVESHHGCESFEDMAEAARHASSYTRPRDLRSKREDDEESEKSVLLTDPWVHHPPPAM